VESAVKIKVYGRVKGIGYRAFARATANGLDIRGYARNLPDEDAVEIEAEGEKTRLEDFILRLKSGHSLARVTKMETHWSEFTGKYPDFSIRYVP
jgi:acylphosphatase